MKKLTVLLSLFFIIVAGGIFLSAETKVSGQQDKDWKVWVKTSPCSGRHDWVAVAKENPSFGGGGVWSNADLILTGTGMNCVRLIDSCTFAAATAEANIVRTSSRFLDYCCREYSVWENSQTGKKSVVVGKFGTAGYGWRLVKPDLCCEEAEALAGIPGACSSDTGQHGSRLIGCYKDPNSPFDLDGYLERSRSNTPQRCIETCRAKGFKYAGVQYGESCLCGNSYGKFGEASNCNMRCTGDSGQICGGSNANSVYSTAASSTADRAQPPTRGRRRPGNIGGGTGNTGGTTGGGTSNPGDTNTPPGVRPCDANERAAFAKMTGTWEASYGQVTFSGSCENVTGFWLQGAYGDRGDSQRGDIKGGRVSGGGLGFNYYQNWKSQGVGGLVNREGSDSCRLSADGKTLECGWLGTLKR